MKRIVTCPKCEAKLAIFDLGKPINQKCPKCGNAFVVESEEKKEPAQEKTVAEEAKKGAAADSSKPVPEDAKKAEEPKPAGVPAKKVEEVSASVSAEATPLSDEKTPLSEAGKAGGPVSTDTPAVPPGKAGETASDGGKKAPPATDKAITLKKPSESPAPEVKSRAPVKSEAGPADTPAVQEQQASGGHSFLFSAAVVGLLVLILVMQVMTKMRADKQYKTLIEHLQFIETKLAK